MTMQDPRDQFGTPPAPVYTGRETFDERPIPVARLPRRRRRPSRARVSTIGLAIASVLWLLALAASQATSPTVAIPFLERTVAALGDIAALLLLHERTIRDTATRSTDSRVAVPGYPVQGITLSRALAQSGTRDEWRAALLNDSAQAAYQRGTAVFVPGGAAPASGAFSTSQWLGVVMKVVSNTTHNGARTLAWSLGLLTVALGVVVLLTADGVRRFVAIGLALTGGAALAAGIGVLGMIGAFLLSLGAGSSTFIEEVGMLIRALSWAPIQEAVRLGIAGLAIALPSAVVAAWLGRGGNAIPED